MPFVGRVHVLKDTFHLMHTSLQLVAMMQLDTAVHQMESVLQRVGKINTGQ